MSAPGYQQLKADAAPIAVKRGASHSLGYRPDIDGLRAVAVIPVILFHVGFASFSGGYVGVDIFFVISGYLIASIISGEIKSGTFTIAGFYERRVRRIFPVLYVVVAASTIAALFLFLPIRLAEFGQSLAAIGVFGSNMLFAVESRYFHAASLKRALLHTWSLAVEEQFYIFFPVLLVFLRSRSQRAVTAILGGLLVLSFAFSAWCTLMHPSQAFYWLPSRAWELLLGACLAVGITRRAANPKVSAICSTLGIGLIAAAIVFYNQDTIFPGVSAALPCLGAALLIFSGIDSKPYVNRVLGFRPLVYVGLISYSLYLWHWPLVVFAENFVDRKLHLGERVLVIALTFALSLASYHFIERPFRSRSGRFTRKFMFRFAAVAIVASVAIGAALSWSKGLPGRMDATTVKFDAASVTKDNTGARCKEMTGPAIRSAGPCAIGAAGATPSFLVWGDSHAEALYPAFQEMAAVNGQAGFVASQRGCSPLLGTIDVWPSRLCRGFNDAMATYAGQHPEIKTVVLVSMWANFAEGISGGFGPTTSLIKDGETREMSFAENGRVFRRGLERTVSRLRTEGKAVFLVADAPELDWDAPDVEAKNRLFHRNIDIRKSLAAYFVRQQKVFGAFRDLEARYQVHVLYPHNILCKSPLCDAAVGDKLLYRDDHHVSLFGARHIEGVLSPIFQ